MTLEEVLKQYINGTYKTLKEAAESNKYTIDQLKYFIRKLSKSKQISDLNLYKEYILVALMNQKEAKIKGGRNGKATTSYTQEDFDKWYDLIVVSDLTLEEVEITTGIPKSVIYENLEKHLSEEKKEQLKAIYTSHKKNPFNKHQDDIEDFKKR